MNANSLKSSLATPIPRAVAWMGYGGLLPFLFLALASIVDQSHTPLWNQALIAYGAVILSFVGALHWSFAMMLADLTPSKRNECYVWSVIPALMAWLAIELASFVSAAILVLGFFIQCLQDYRLVTASNLPIWYFGLRLRLSIVAGLSLSVLFFH